MKWIKEVLMRQHHVEKESFVPSIPICRFSAIGNELKWSNKIAMNASKRHSVMFKIYRDYIDENTFHLTFGLMEENSNLLVRFTNADRRHLTFATMEQVRSRHASTVETLADIVLDLRQSNLKNPKFDNLVDVFLRNRLGLQLLCDHYVSLHKGKTTNVGVSVDCKLIDVVKDAVTEAKHICDAHYENVPQVCVNIPANAQITLIRPWVHHALVELLKNAMASSFAKVLDNEAPLDILVELHETASEFVVLNVLDQGTGVQHVDEAFAFAFLLPNRDGTNSMSNSPMPLYNPFCKVWELDCH
jgi:pyruvate dehydrogenase kinase 2/3/4